MSSVKDILAQIKDEDIRFVDLRFTDPRGKLQHVTLDANIVDEDMFEEGAMFDGSSIAGWKAINESDMVFDAGSGLRLCGPIFWPGHHVHQLRHFGTRHLPTL